MKKRLIVFLCSTYADLIDERERVLDAVRRLQLQHDSMEFFGARADQPIETCLEEVRRSDVLIVIVGHRYGNLVPKLGVSFSEAEYREGQRLGKPCLVYLRDEDVPVLPRHIERDPDKIRLLDRWKEILATRHTVAKFPDAQRLAVQVSADLSRTVQALQEAEQHRPAGPMESQTASVSELQSMMASATEKGISQELILSTLRRALVDLEANTGGRKPVVFLSHAHSDEPLVRRVAKGLKAEGIEVWMDEAELALGDSLVRHIQRGLDFADFVAFFLSKASAQNQWVRQELNVVISRQVSGNRGAVVLPILLEDAEIPPLLRDVMYLDLRNRDVEAGVKKLVAAIRRHELERLHTFATKKNRYYNPPSIVATLGRQLAGASFVDLISQLGRDEVLFGLYQNRVDALVATHLHSKGRMDEMESRFAPAKGYYALTVDLANEGCDEKIPSRLGENGEAVA